MQQPVVNSSLLLMSQRTFPIPIEELSDFLHQIKKFKCPNLHACRDECQHEETLRYLIVYGSNIHTIE